MNALDILRALGACDDALEWVEAQPDQSREALWRECQRADWMLWYLGTLVDRDGYGSKVHRRVILIACLCARTASIHWRDPSCERAVSLAERWAWGDKSVTCEELRAASVAVVYSNHAHDAAADAAHAAAARTAYASAVAVDTAYGAAVYAASAHARTSAVSATFAYINVRMAYLANLADLIRAAVPEVPM